MKKRICVIVIGLLLIGANLYAAGDLIVNGKLGVGNATPANKVDIASTDETGFNVLVTKTANPFLNGSFITLNVNATDAGANGLLFVPKHTKFGTTTGIMRGAIYAASLQGSGTLTAVTGMQNQLAVASTGNYNIDKLRGNEIILTKSGPNTGTQTLTNYNGVYSGGVNAGLGVINGTNWRHAYFTDFPSFDGTVTNVTGLWIDQQTSGVNNRGIVLNGNGPGADIVFITTQEASIYSSGGEIFVKDGGSNITQISPHDPKTGEWVFYSKNTKTGRVVKINMEKLVKAVEKLTGETFMVETLMEE